MSLLSETVSNVISGTNIAVDTLQTNNIETPVAYFDSVTFDNLSVTNALFVNNACDFPVSDIHIKNSLASNGNVFLGSSSVQSVGVLNNCWGVGAGANLTTGSGNQFLGTNAGASVTDKSANVAIGINALGGAAGTVGSSNVAIGRNSCRGTVGDDNIAIGANALNDAGSLNVVIGNNTAGAATASIGSNNIIIGNNAGNAFTLSNQNILMGNGANTGSAGQSNTFVLGNNCIGPASNTIYIGRDPAGSYNRMILGNNNVNSLIPGPYADDNAAKAAATPVLPGQLYFTTVNPGLITEQNILCICLQ